jgi:hypothetical protein
MQNKQALFIIGSPGSGKDVVIRDITSNYGIVEFTSTQIDEMLSNDAAFKRAKLEKQNSLLERYSIIVTANSFDLGFVMTRELLESIGYSTHLIFVEADLSVAVDRLKNRKNLKESLDRISVGNSNKYSILGLFESGIVVDNSKRLDLCETREFISSILSELSFRSDLSLDEITKIDLKKKIQKIVPVKMPASVVDTRGGTQGTWSATLGGVSESIDVPSYDISPIATGPLQSMNTNTASMKSDLDKENTRKLLGKIKRINFKQVVPRGI